MHSSLVALREAVARRLPPVELPELLLEVHAWTGFAGEFTHVSEGGARVDDLATSVCAVLLAEACNIGLEPLVRREVPALTRGRLLWVQQNYLRAETLARANARLVDYQTTIPLARAWGGGEVASADGLRFVVPVRTLNAGPNPKYFGAGRGVTYYTWTSDQYTGFHGIVVPGTLRDSLFILDGLLEHQTGLQPAEVMSDTAGYSDLVFGLFWLLGYQFSPRLADLGDTRFWRLDPHADYGPLNGLARHRLNADRIARHWDDLLRVAGSLKLGAVSASQLIRSLHGRAGGGRPSELARVISELGRVPKTLHLLAFVDDEAYRRRILVQLNRGEGRHGLARAVFHGQKGELRQRYREGQEDQLGALGLVVNAIVLWNTFYMDRALASLWAGGVPVLPADVERLSPLGAGHINLLGRYHLTLPEAQRRGEPRPLRDPARVDDEVLSLWG
jgi:TnpA family transposase